MQPEVSIIIPLYNNANTIMQTLKSLSEQTLAHWECLVIDDGSTDDSRCIVESYNLQDTRVRLHVRPNHKPKGANACRNYGLSLSKGAYILFLDADDVLLRTCLEKRLQLFAVSNPPDFVVANTALLQNNEFGNKVVNFDPEVEKLEHYLLSFFSYNIPWVSTLSVLWKREVVKSHPFDERLQRFQDIDFYISILKGPWKMERLKIVDNYYRVEPDKIKDERHIEIVLENLLLFFKKHISFVIASHRYKEAFKLFNNYFFYQYVLPNCKTFATICNSLLKHIYASHLYSKKERYIFKVHVFLVRSGLNKIKFLGIHTLNQFLKHKLQSTWKPV